MDFPPNPWKAASIRKKRPRSSRPKRRTFTAAYKLAMIEKYDAAIEPGAGGRSRDDAAELVRVGELFRDAVRLNAAGVILVHNHPSGDPTPSPDDLHLTAEALAAGRLLDIQLLDHLVIGQDAYVSLRDRGVAFDRADPGASRAADA